MLANSNETTSKDAVFGDFTIYDYAEIDSPLEMVKFFLDFWRAKGGEDKTITRADISPMELKQYISQVVLMDVVREGNGWKLIVRLIGGHVSGFYGEITGKDVREMDNTKAIERIYSVCSRMLETEKPIYTVAPALSPDRSYMEALALYLPLFDDEGKINKIMVAVHVSAPTRP